MGELVRRSVGKYSDTVRLLRYKSHIYSVSKINVLLKAYRCPSCDQFIKRVHDLDRHLTTCKERVKHVFPKNIYDLRETLFDKLDSFSILYSNDKRLFMNMVIFDFESVCVQADKIYDTDTTS